MATIIEFPRPADGEWPALLRSIEKAAAAWSLDSDQIRVLIEVMKVEWEQYFNSSISLELPQRFIEISALSAQDLERLRALWDAQLSDATTAMRTHMLGLLQVLAWERAWGMSQGIAPFAIK